MCPKGRSLENNRCLGCVLEKGIPRFLLGTFIHWGNSGVGLGGSLEGLVYGGWRMWCPQTPGHVLSRYGRFSWNSEKYSEMIYFPNLLSPFRALWIFEIFVLMSILKEAEVCFALRTGLLGYSLSETRWLHPKSMYTSLPYTTHSYRENIAYQPSISHTHSKGPVISDPLRQISNL